MLNYRQGLQVASWALVMCVFTYSIEHAQVATFQQFYSCKTSADCQLIYKKNEISFKKSFDRSVLWDWLFHQ